MAQTLLHHLRKSWRSPHGRLWPRVGLSGSIWLGWAGLYFPLPAWESHPSRLPLQLLPWAWVLGSKRCSNTELTKFCREDQSLLCLHLYQFFRVSPDSLISLDPAA